MRTNTLSRCVRMRSVHGERAWSQRCFFPLQAQHTRISKCVQIDPIHDSSSHPSWTLRRAQVTRLHEDLQDAREELEKERLSIPPLCDHDSTVRPLRAAGGGTGGGAR